MNQSGYFALFWQSQYSAVVAPLHQCHVVYSTHLIKCIFINWTDKFWCSQIYTVNCKELAMEIQGGYSPSITFLWESIMHFNWNYWSCVNVHYITHYTTHTQGTCLLDFSHFPWLPSSHSNCPSSPCFPGGWLGGDAEKLHEWRWIHTIF